MFYWENHCENINPLMIVLTNLVQKHFFKDNYEWNDILLQYTWPLNVGYGS